MARILSGLQPSGQLHLGNYAGAIRQFIDLQAEHDVFVFVASYHALTSIGSAEALRANCRQAVIDYLAFGLDPARCHIYLQQDLPEVTELAWMLACACPMYLMEKGVSYKDKVSKGLSASVGLFSYPILQAADILIVDAELVPVGRDQIQHIEITRDLAQKFNHHWQSEVFVLPAYRVQDHVAVVPGIDGQKMSKSYGNDIDPFMAEKPLRKRIMKIVTDSTPLEEPKDPQICPVYQITRAIAGEDAEPTRDLARRYQAGNYGYGHAKQFLFELILDHFGPARRRREELMADSAYIDRILAEGAEAARAVGRQTLERARRACGIS